MNSALFQILREWGDTPFSYGRDCCQFASAVVESVAGYNPMAGLDYRDESGANAFIAGYGTLMDAVTAHLGEPSEPPYKTGDVTLHYTNDDQVVGVIIDGRSVVRTKTGITDWSIDRAICVWSV